MGFCWFSSDSVKWSFHYAYYGSTSLYRRRKEDIVMVILLVIALVMLVYGILSTDYSVIFGRPSQ